METTGKAVPIRPGLRVEWLALRGYGGFAYYPAFGPNALGGGELVLVTLVWRHFYWELVRVAGVYPYLYNVGTAFGIPIRLDRAGDRQLRLGVHVTFPGPGLWSNAPVASGLQLHYHRRVSRRFAWHIGLMQFSYPGICICFSLGIGF